MAVSPSPSADLTTPAKAGDAIRPRARLPLVTWLLAVGFVGALVLMAGLVWIDARLRKAHRESDEHLQRATEAMDRLVGAMADAELSDAPAPEADRRKWLPTALAFFQDLQARQAADPGRRREAARTCGRVAELHQLLGDLAAAEQARRAAVALLEEAAAKEPDSADRRGDLAAACHDLGLVLNERERSADAEETLSRALALRQQLAADFPDRPEYRRDAATSRYALGALLATQPARATEARQAYEQAAAGQEEVAAAFPDQAAYRDDLARTFHDLGVLLKAEGNEEAGACFRRAVEIRKGLAAGDPERPVYLWKLARSYNNLGGWLEARAHGGDAWRGADDAYLEAWALLAKLVGLAPTVPAYWRELADTHGNRGRLLQSVGKPAEAEAALRQELDTRQKLAAYCPDVAEYRRDLGLAYHDLGELLASNGRGDDGEAAFREALTVQKKLAEQFPAVADYQGDLGATLYNLGRMRFDQGEADRTSQAVESAVRSAWNPSPLPWALELSAFVERREACRFLRDAVRHDRAALDANPSPPRFRKGLRDDYTFLASSLLALGEHAEAAAAAEQLAAVFAGGWEEERRTEYVRAAELLAHAAGMAEAGGAEMQAERYERKAVEFLREAVASGYRDAEALREQAAFEPLRERNDFQEVLRDLDKKAKAPPDR